MKDYRVKGAKCLNCKRKLTGASGDGERPPEPNDVSVCAYCGHLQAYGDDLKFRELNDAEIIECAGDPEILAAQDLSRRFREFWRDGP